MKKLILLSLMLVMVLGLTATVTQATLSKDFLVMTDVGIDVSPINSYATDKDGVASDAFPGTYISGKVILAVAAVLDTLDGTNINHVTPIVQVSADGTTWADAFTYEGGSSSAVTIGTRWAMTIDLTDYFAPWYRIVYVAHTSAHATISDMSNLGGEAMVSTSVYVIPRK